MSVAAHELSERRPVLGPGLAFFGYLCLLVGFGAIGLSTQQRNALWAGPGSQAAGLWVTEIFGIALPALIAFRAANARPSAFAGLQSPGGAALGAAALVALLNQPIVALLEWIAYRAAPESLVRAFEAKNAMLEQMFADNKLWLIVTVTVAAPLGEELFFRGFALPAMARRWGPAAAIVLSGALFAAIHLDPIGFLGLWQLGILFGILRWATGSLWPAVIAHAANNGLAAAAFVLGLQKPSDPPPGWLLVVGALFLAGAIPLAVKAVRRPPPALPREEPWTLRDLRLGFHLGRAWGMLLVWLLAVAIGLVMLVQQIARSAPTRNL